MRDSRNEDKDIQYNKWPGNDREVKAVLEGMVAVIGSSDEGHTEL